jgi:hypothetical protein
MMLRSRLLIEGHKGCTVGTRFFSAVVDPENSYAFSGCGWLTPFHLGVLDELIRRGRVNNRTIFAGSSGGAIAALVGCSGVDPRLALEKSMELSTNKNFWDDIDAGLRDKALMVALPDDIVERCNSRLHVTGTRVWPKPSSKATVFSTFDSLDDILSCVATSCFIPFYCSKKFYVEHRGERYIDGGVFSVMPEIGAVKVSPLPRAIFPKHLKPDIYPSPKLSIREVTRNAFIPPPPLELEKLYNIGIESARIWCDQNENHLDCNTASC